MGKQSDFEQLRLLRSVRNKTELVKHNGVYMTVSQKQELQKHFCAMCAKPKTNPKIYYGEEFCGDCVERCIAGYPISKN